MELGSLEDVTWKCSGVPQSVSSVRKGPTHCPGLFMEASFHSHNWPRQRFSAGVPWEFLKHVIPDYKVRALMFFPLVCQIKKSGSSQHNNSHSVWMNQNYAYFLSDRQNIYILVCRRSLVISLCVPSNEKGWKSLSQFKARQLSSWYVPFKTYYLNFTEKAAPDVKTQIQVYVF